MMVRNLGMVEDAIELEGNLRKHSVSANSPSRCSEAQLEAAEHPWFLLNSLCAVYRSLIGELRSFS
jgi:hypothetical protein